MRTLKLSKAFTLIEPGPVVLVTTFDGRKNNVMTITWTMVLDFTPRFALATGAWNYSFRALDKTRECVLAIPGADLLDTAVGIGTCSGADVDKFAKFNLTPVPAKIVRAPLIQECLAITRAVQEREQISLKRIQLDAEVPDARCKTTGGGHMPR